jgi:hypothetical protein
VCGPNEGPSFRRARVAATPTRYRLCHFLEQRGLTHHLIPRPTELAACAGRAHQHNGNASNARALATHSHARVHAKPTEGARPAQLASRARDDEFFD